MARRTRKSAPRPLINTLKSAAIHTFPKLPDAVFIGKPSREDLEQARYLQAVRHEYEQDGHAPTLIQELTQFGFPDNHIAEALFNPASITSCTYACAYADIAAAWANSSMPADGLRQ
jgi:hypothetical protein